MSAKTLSYKGNVGMPAGLIGPSLDGPFWIAVRRAYDEEADVTRVTFVKEPDFLDVDR